MTVKTPAMLTLSRVSDGRTLLARSGSLLGRSGETEEFFRDSRTVSRSHARANLVDGTWRIEDLGSMNGTWVNGRRIKPGEPHPIASGDTVALSLACEMRVIE
jgi:predicted component of type VI protein secretion system